VKRWKRCIPGTELVLAGADLRAHAAGRCVEPKINKQTVNNISE
jgi:hypothetical protein